MPNQKQENGQSEAVRTSFIGTLVADIISSKRAAVESRSQSNYRHLVRAFFAAIEGMVWGYREHIIDIARSTDSLTIEEEIAFSEVSYSVTPQGKIVETARFVPLLPMFRLTTQLAQRLNPDLEPQFDDQGWGKLKAALEIRNRVTHPKSQKDLEITEADLSICEDGFNWIFDLCLAAMEHANIALSRNTETFRSFLEELKRGDPEAWAAYRTAHKTSDRD